MELAVGSTLRTEVVTTVAAEADVLVAGGGTAGCLAAVAAARGGADVLLVERRNSLGGMMTGGNAGLTKYIVHEKSQAEYRTVWRLLETDPESVQAVGGITMELTQRLIDSGAGLGTFGRAGSYVFTDQQEFRWTLLDMMEEAGVRLLLHSMVVDVITEDDAVRGVVVEGKSGRQALVGRLTIDATGDADVAAKAGAPFVLGVGPDDLAAKENDVPLGTMQQMGIMFRMANVDMARCFEYLKAHPDQFRVQPFALLSLDDACDSFLRGEMSTLNITGIGHGFQIYNTPIPGVFTFCCPSYAGDGTSTEDLTRGELALAKEIRKRVAQMRDSLTGFEKARVVDCPEICVRETRHVQGEYVLTIEDVLSDRQFEDSIGRGCHPIDIQPAPSWIRAHKLEPRWSFTIPYRCLVPLEVEALLIAGRCISTTHEASGCTRPTAQCMITGEAAGTAAALCFRRGESPRTLDHAALRAALLAQGTVL